MEVKEIISELYALRAGLSLIAQEKDKYDKEVALADFKRNSAADVAEYETSHKIRSIESPKTVDPSEVAQKKREWEEAKKRYEENEKNTKKHAIAKPSKLAEIILPLRLTIGILLTIIHLASYVVMCVFFSLDFFPAVLTISINIGTSLIIAVVEIIMGIRAGVITKDYLSVWVFIMHIACTLSPIGILFGVLNTSEPLLIIFFCASILPNLWIFGQMIYARVKFYGIDENAASNSYRQERDYRDALSKSERLKKEVEEAEKLYRETADAAYTAGVEKKVSDAKASALKKELENRVAQLDDEYTASCQASAKKHYEVCSQIYETLVKAYGELLDTRDWGILDLVIWQLETKRADTLKEALQLADRETQTDRIVRAMQSASEAISQSISDGFNTLLTQIYGSLNTLTQGLKNATTALSSQISASEEHIVSKIDEGEDIFESLDENHRKAMLETTEALDRLSSQASLQSALAEKSNTSSKELVEAVKKLKEAATLTFIPISLS